MKTGNGKIANLPAKVRDELNRRINDGEEGKELLEWLNAKPEVVDVVTRLFDGKPISQQNLSQWRTHGYRQWHVHHIIVQEMMGLASNSEDFEETGVDCEKLVGALTANYAEMIQRWIITPPEQMTYRREVFKDLTHEVLAPPSFRIPKATTGHPTKAPRTQRKESQCRRRSRKPAPSFPVSRINFTAALSPRQSHGT